MKFAVRIIKNQFFPLKVSEGANLRHGQMVLVRTEKGEEAHKVFIVNSEIQKHLAEIIARFDDSEISGSLISILKVETYADFSMTKVYISVFGDAEKKYKIAAKLK